MTRLRLAGSRCARRHATRRALCRVRREWRYTPPPRCNKPSTGQCGGHWRRVFCLPAPSASWRGWRWRRSVAYDLVPRRMVFRGSCMVFRRMPRRGGSIDRVSFRSRRPHRRGCSALGRRIASGSSALAPLGYPLALYESLGPHCVRRVRHSRSAKCAADCESHHQLLYGLVHCRVPFVLRASPFSCLHNVRTLRLKILAKSWKRKKPLALASFLQHSKVATYPERLDFGII